MELPRRRCSNAFSSESASGRYLNVFCGKSEREGPGTRTGSLQTVLTRGFLVFFPPKITACRRKLFVNVFLSDVRPRQNYSSPFYLNCTEEISTEIFLQAVKLIPMTFSAGILLHLG